MRKLFIFLNKPILAREQSWYSGMQCKPYSSSPIPCHTTYTEDKSERPLPASSRPPGGSAPLQHTTVGQPRLNFTGTRRSVQWDQRLFLLDWKRSKYGWLWPIPCLDSLKSVYSNICFLCHTRSLYIMLL